MLAPRLRVSSLVSALLLSVPFGAGCGGDDGEPADGGVSAGLAKTRGFRRERHIHKYLLFSSGELGSHKV